MIQVQDLVHHQPSQTEPVHIPYPSFSVQRGGQLAVVGPSGSGKTTLLHYLSGLLVSQQGTVQVEGTDLAALSEPARDRFRARHIGYVFQDFHLIEGYTSLENVMLSLGLGGVRGSAARERAREALKRVDLGHRLHHTPAQLSTGERQRVAIARALVHTPSVLLADEPTAHLDQARSHRTMHLLKETAHELQASLLVVTHDPLVLDHLPTTLQLGARA